MADTADILKARFTFIGEVIASVPDRLVWRWDNYRHNEGLRVNGYHDGGKSIDFRRPGDEKAALYAGNIRPVDDIQNEVESRAVPTGDPYTQWAEEGRFENSTVRTQEILDQIAKGLLPNDFDFLDYVYTAHFSETLSWEESKELGFRQAISSTFGVEVGGDVYGGKASASVTAEVESTQGISETKGDEEEQGDEESFSIRVPSDTVRIIQAKRTIGPMKYVITGWGDLEHSITIGKHWDGNWNGHRGKGGRKYKRHAHWDSFADFLMVIKGRGARDMDLWDWFRQHPVSASAINSLARPLDQPFRQDVPYDNVGQTELVYK